MATRKLQSKDDLQKHLAEQLQHLIFSAKAFDEGMRSEARRLAVTIRLLVHDTNSSKSLLGQLGLKDLLFLDTSWGPVPGNLLSHTGLVGQKIELQDDQGSAEFWPWLDETDDFRFVAFDSWWHKIVIIDQAENEFSRKDIILSVANQDGGAHVDPKIDEKYAKLSRENSLKIQEIGPGKERPLLGAELATIRQIAYEIEITLDAKRKTTKIGRNEICPCGSGVKYKRCHDK